MHGAVEKAIELQQPGLLIQLVLVTALLGDLDEDLEQLGRIVTVTDIVPGIEGTDTHLRISFL
jgi:hypothetical protein